MDVGSMQFSYILGGLMPLREKIDLPINLVPIVSRYCPIQTPVQLLPKVLHIRLVVNLIGRRQTDVVTSLIGDAHASQGLRYMQYPCSIHCGKEVTMLVMQRS